MNDRPLIVGIDPGNTSGIAAIDFDGETVLVESRIEFPSSEIIKRLIEEGRPVVVSCDKSRMPSSVDKIATSLGAEKFVPEEDLSRQRKRELSSEGENSHEKDAYASAVHAYKNLRKQVRKINKRSEGKGLERYETAKRHLSD